MKADDDFKNHIPLMVVAIALVAIVGIVTKQISLIIILGDENLDWETLVTGALAVFAAWWTVSKTIKYSKFKDHQQFGDAKLDLESYLKEINHSLIGYNRMLNHKDLDEVATYLKFIRADLKTFDDIPLQHAVRFQKSYDITLLRFVATEIERYIEDALNEIYRLPKIPTEENLKKMRNAVAACGTVVEQFTELNTGLIYELENTKYQDWS